MNNDTREYGKIPPQAADIERTVIGELLIDRDAYDTVSDLLTAEAFYKESNQKIYKAIQMTEKAIGNIDMMTVANQLNMNGDLDKIGGLFALNEIVKGISSSYNIVNHVRIVVDKYNLREVIRVCNQSIDAAYDNQSDPSEVVDKFQSDVLAIDMNDIVKSGGLVYDSMLSYMNDLNSDTPPSYFVKSPIEKINIMSNGFGGGTLTGIGARPSHGKSSFAVELIDNASRVEKVPSALFALEMKTRELAVRRIAADTGLSTTHLGSGKDKINAKAWQDIELAVDKYKDVDFYIDDSPRLTIGTLKAKIRRLFKKGYRLFVIDYLQLMSLDSHHRGDKNAGYGDISKQLKELAMELDVPIIVILQLNRKVEDRPKDKQIPLLSDIRDSGEIEQNLDNCIFIANPKKIGLKSFKVNGKTYSMKNIAIADFAKCRNGETGIFFIGKSDNQMNWYNVNASDHESDDFGKTPSDYVNESQDNPF